MEKELDILIGLEVHCQLTSLKTKLFCSCSSDYRGKEPNTNICPICMGLPGTLPSVNMQAIKEAIKIALALNAKIANNMLFFRKNYFYPDLPKNFQISQYDKAGGIPLASNGHIKLSNGKVVRIRRIHLEEDPAKISYEGNIATSPYTLVDYNRAGIALVEIVTEPDMKSPKEAREFLQMLHSTLEHLGVVNPELEGALRCDANISIKGCGRVEVKNVSSFKEVERALSFEITRQKARLKGGLRIFRETRHWDEVRRITVSLRVKEEEEDYRYFPEPDLVPVKISKDIIEDVKQSMPELPKERSLRFVRDYKLSKEVAEVLTSNKIIADFFEECAKIANNPRRVGNWLVSEILGYLNREGLEFQDLKLKHKDIVRISNMVDDKEISEKVAKEMIYGLIKGEEIDKIIKRIVRPKASESEVLKVVNLIFKKNEKAVSDAIKDKRAINFLVGQVMKECKGQAEPKVVLQLITKKIKELEELKVKR
jgi:aspartyl-tRNA(Asn)/glutamyl-tRNA(Gln) amidotransferase subunit B